MSFREYLKEKFLKFTQTLKHMSRLTWLGCQGFIISLLGLALPNLLGLVMAIFGCIEFVLSIVVYPDYINWKRRKEKLSNAKN